VWKKKSNYVFPTWDWAPDECLVPRGYFRWFRDNHRWKATIEGDEIEAKDTGIKCTVRTRGDFPQLWDDLYVSRGYYVRSWKDRTKRRKQWDKGR
jgi:hypothetical protein